MIHSFLLSLPYTISRSPFFSLLNPKNIEPFEADLI